MPCLAAAHRCTDQDSTVAAVYYARLRAVALARTHGFTALNSPPHLRRELSGNGVTQVAVAYLHKDSNARVLGNSPKVVCYAICLH
jgi:hypothetical protein